MFQDDLNPDRILADIAIYMNMEIRPEIDLVIFDEIQISNRALNSLKYFAEKQDDVHMAAAGSLLGVKMSGPGSFPVGKVNFLHLYPMTFLEFLVAMKESRYRKLLENADPFVSLTEAFHVHLIDLLRRYYFVGGMPEAVKHFAQTGNGREIREIQQEIIKSYILGFCQACSRQPTFPNLPGYGIPYLSILQGKIKNSSFPRLKKEHGRERMKMP